MIPSARLNKIHWILYRITPRDGAAGPMRGPTGQTARASCTRRLKAPLPALAGHITDAQNRDRPPAEAF